MVMFDGTMRSSAFVLVVIISIFSIFYALLFLQFFCFFNILLIPFYVISSPSPPFCMQCEVLALAFLYLAHDQMDVVIGETVGGAAEDNGEKDEEGSQQDQVVHIWTRHFDVSVKKIL